MILQTKFSGEIDIKDEEIFYFEGGLLAFEEYKRYVLLDINEFFKCLQSVDKKEVAFIILDPWRIFKDYEADINDEELAGFKDKDINNFLVFTIATVTEERITTNLIGPVILNISSMQGKQTVLNNSNYTTKHTIMESVKKV